MALTAALQRRVKSRKDESDDEVISGTDSPASERSQPATVDDEEGSLSNGSESEGDQNGDEDRLQPSGSHPPEEVAELSSISFGALAKAQQSLGERKRKRLEDPSDSSILPKRSQDPVTSRLSPSQSAEAIERRAGKNDHRDFSRSSKHAPAELSSKKAVSRKRGVVPTTKLDHRDPRFEHLSGPIDEMKTKRDYAFLEEYRDDEMKQLKETIHRTKRTDEATTEALKRALLSMESKKKAQAAKDKQQEIIRTHRAKEKELIKQGKKPFYLKKSEQKKLALVERFRGLKGKQMERVMERKRKKKAGRERKNMPDVRRGVDE
ncbi:MAG: hypothetical protein FRX48_04472 [Lasallia pustulata]|uniref:rRNA biogenesis protein RRP36 n=1 Tax=Lasallia pustulata TaxID=136370 RepID=A0A5M8PTJ8_9LECA|nr:MAG: hypothetical protein FRX48_04472 [Lasallia pustulata]